jgi:hypothetical protein
VFPPVVQVAGFNYQLAYSSQNPVTELPPSEAGFYDVFGSAWEWAEDHFAALPGKPMFASAPCHFILVCICYLVLEGWYMLSSMHTALTALHACLLLGPRDLFACGKLTAGCMCAVCAGFKVHPYYEDFSSPCFAGLHQLVGAAAQLETSAWQQLCPSWLWCSASVQKCMPW